VTTRNVDRTFKGLLAKLREFAYVQTLAKSIDRCLCKMKQTPPAKWTTYVQNLAFAAQLGFPPASTQGNPVDHNSSFDSFVLGPSNIPHLRKSGGRG